jgi:glycosyltransferase involved in cell wall biosynthesis
MKILQVIDRLNIGGAERVLVDMSNLLHEQGINVSVLFLLYPGPMGNELNPDIPTFILNRKRRFSVTSFYKCALHLKKFDIIHCHHQYIFNYIKLTCFLFGIRKPIILHDHGPNRILNKKFAFLSMIFKPTCYIGVSSQLIQWAKAYFRLNENRIFLLPNIIRKKNTLHFEKKYDLILVSNIKPEKNQLFAIRLAKTMQKKLLIVGNPQDEDYFNLIKSASDSTVTFISDCTDATQYISQSAFGLHTSASETGPLVLLEYMAYGIPFLAFDTGEVAKICKAQYPDFIISNFTIPDWTSRISKIKDTYTTTPAHELQSFFDHHFGEQSYLTKCLKIYEQISENS